MVFTVGQTVRELRQFTQADFDEFARLSGDDNPIHVDSAFAAGTRFGQTVAHGMLLYGTICGLLSSRFPGAAQLEQSLMFPAPTFAGESITITAEVTAVMNEQRQASITITMTNSEGRHTCEGETLMAWGTREAG